MMSGVWNEVDDEWGTELLGTDEGFELLGIELLGTDDEWGMR